MMWQNLKGMDLAIAIAFNYHRIITVRPASTQSKQTETSQCGASCMADQQQQASAANTNEQQGGMDV